MKVGYLIVIGLLLIQCSNAQQTKPVDWTTDLDYLAKELPEKHYNLFTVRSKEEFLSGLNAVKSRSVGVTTLTMALMLQQLIARFGDSHTHVNLGPHVDKSQILPLQLEWFKDGLYIFRTTPENDAILGQQIIAVNDVPLKTIMDSLGTLTSRDNQSVVKNVIPDLLPLVQVLQYFGFVHDQKIVLGLKDSSGKTSQGAIRPATMNRTNRKTYVIDMVALCFQNPQLFFLYRYLPADRIFYLQYNKCWSKELEVKYGNALNAEKLPSFNEFEDRVFHTLKTEPANKIIVDLRFNEGGNSEQGTLFIQKLNTYLRDHPQVKPYVIIGRLTFSSAILNAMDLKQLPNVVFVGEETAGKPNHFGELRSFRLPVSGIEISYATKYFKRSDQNEDTITPDVTLEPTFTEFSKGIDPAYEWIRKQ